MNILFLMANFGSGGSERTVKYLSEYLVEKGDTVSLVIIGNSIFYDIDDRIKLVKLNIPSSPKRKFEQIGARFLRLFKVRLAVRKENPDIVFCILPDVIKYIYGLKRRLSFKIISSERALPEYYSEKELKVKLRQYRECDGLIFQTERAACFYSKLIKCNSRVIYNAVGNKLVYRTYSRNNVRNSIAAMGRLTDQKDYVTLIKAFSIVNQIYANYNMEIYGEGPDRQALQELIDSLGLNDKVKLMGACTNAIQKIADARMYVLSSKFEGMPNSLMEAMGVGLPVISTDCPNGPAELIENNVNGILVPVGNVTALAKAIIYLIENEDKAETMGKYAKKILDTNNIQIKAEEYRTFIWEIFKEN